MLCIFLASKVLYTDSDSPNHASLSHKHSAALDMVNWQTIALLPDPQPPHKHFVQLVVRLVFNLTDKRYAKLSFQL